MELRDKRGALCAWCGDQIMDEKGFVIEGKQRTIMNIRDNIAVFCTVDHAKLYSELPTQKCHFMSPHSCKLVPPNIAIAPVECDCPGKHLFCCQEIKDCFIKDIVPQNNELESLHEVLSDLLPLEKPVILLGDKDKRCATCNCGYREFKHCYCGTLRCSICHAFDRCITCSTETWIQTGLRYSGLRYVGSFVMKQRNPNKTIEKCPQCYSGNVPISYLISPCCHMCCAICQSKKIRSCNVCKNKIEAIDKVFLKYWATKDYVPDVIIQLPRFTEL